MNPQDVLAYLKEIPAFRDLDREGEEQLLRLIPYVSERTYEPGEKVLDRQRPTDRTVCIVEGTVELTRTNDQGERRTLGTRGPGSVIGRQSLEVRDYDTFTATAQGDVRALVLHFRDMVRVYDQSDYLQEALSGPLQPLKLLPYLREITLFENFGDRVGTVELHRVAREVHDQFFDNGEWVFRQGETSDRLYYVLEGQIRLMQVDQQGVVSQVDVLEPGDFAGETGLLVGDFHDVTGTAEGFARVLYIESEDFHELLETRPHLERRLNVSSEVAQRRRLPEFDWLRDDEWIITVVQRHWLRLFRQIGIPTLILLLLFPALYITILAEGTFLNILSVIFALPVLGLLIAVVWQYLNWRDDYFIVTTQRVVHSERVWPFPSESEETSLGNIQDIYELRPSLISNILNFGNLVLQTAGETVEVDMKYIPNPARVRQVISDEIDRANARELLRTQGKIRQLLARRLRIQEEPEETELVEEEEARHPFFVASLVRSAWEYIFPPSWLEAEEGETIIWRRYWLPGFTHYALAFLPAAASTLLGGYYLITRIGESGFLLWFVLWSILEALTLMVLMWFVEDWRNDYFQLTPSHIILIEQRPLLLQESRREARLDRIQNLGFEVPNFAARVFNYGHVYFETAGSEGRFELKWLRDPKRVQSTISDRQYQYNQRQQQIAASRRQQELLSWFSTYDDLRQEAPG